LKGELDGVRIVRCDKDWLCARVGDWLVMMGIGDGRYLSLDDTGRRIWELLESSPSLDVLCRRLADEYAAAPDDIRGDVVVFVERLARLGVVTVDR